MSCAGSDSRSSKIQSLRIEEKGELLLKSCHAAVALHEHRQQQEVIIEEAFRRTSLRSQDTCSGALAAGKDNVKDADVNTVR
eukprot:452859-Rhodomonas_salina.3